MKFRSAIKRTSLILVVALLFLGAGKAANYTTESKLLPKKVNPNQEYIIYGKFNTSDHSSSLLQEDMNVVVQEGKEISSLSIQSHNHNGYALTDGIFWQKLRAPEEEGEYTVKVKIGDKVSDILILKVINRSDKVGLFLNKDLGFKQLFLTNVKIRNDNNTTAADTTLKVGKKSFDYLVDPNSTKKIEVINLSFAELDIVKGANFVPILLEGTINTNSFASRFGYETIRNGYTALSKELYSFEFKGKDEVNITRGSSRKLEFEVENKGIADVYSLSVEENDLDVELSKEKLKLRTGEEDGFNLEISAPVELAGETLNLTLIAKGGNVQFEKELKVHVKNKHLVELDNFELGGTEALMGSTLKGQVEIENKGDFDEIFHLEAHFRGQKPSDFGTELIGEGESMTKKFFLQVPKDELGKKEVVVGVYGENFGDRITKEVSIVKESKSFRSGLSPNSLILENKGKEVRLMLSSTGTQPNRLNISVRGWKDYEGLGPFEKVLEPGDYREIPIVFNPQEIEGTQRDVQVRVCSIDTGECNTHDLEITLRKEEPEGGNTIFDLIEKKTKIKPGEGALVNLNLKNNYSVSKDYELEISGDFESMVRVTDTDFSLRSQEEKEVSVFFGTEEDLEVGNYSPTLIVKENGQEKFHRTLTIQVVEKTKRGAFAGVTGMVTSLPGKITLVSLGVVALFFLILTYLKKRREKEVSYETYKRK